MREVARLATNVQIAPAEDRRQRLEAAADIEDESERLILLCILEQEVAEVGFAASRHAQNQRVSDFAVVQVQKVRVYCCPFQEPPGIPRPDAGSACLPGRIVKRNERSA